MGCDVCYAPLLHTVSLQGPSKIQNTILSWAEGHLQPGLAPLHLCFNVAVSFPHPNNNSVPSGCLLIALGLLGLCGALKALPGWLAVCLVKLALKSHPYPNPAFLCPAGMFLMQSLCSSGQSCPPGQAQGFHAQLS